jgi:hypothetical protein
MSDVKNNNSEFKNNSLDFNNYLKLDNLNLKTPKELLFKFLQFINKKLKEIKNNIALIKYIDCSIYLDCSSLLSQNKPIYSINIYYKTFIKYFLHKNNQNNKK